MNIYIYIYEPLYIYIYPNNRGEPAGFIMVFALRRKCVNTLLQVEEESTVMLLQIALSLYDSRN